MSPDPELLKRSQYFTPPNTEHPHSSRTHFLDWQEHHRPLARMHHAHLHDWGIASGLAVSVTGDGNAVEVQPGVAIDALGELIALSGSGQADTSLVQPGEPEQPQSAPFRLSTANLAGQTRYVTIQFAERLRFGEGAGGKLEQTPWLRLQPTVGEGAYVDDGTAIVLAIVKVAADGAIILQEQAAELPVGRRKLATKSGSLQLYQPRVIAGQVTEQISAQVAPLPTGGLRVTVPAAGDTILLQQQSGGRFAKLTVQAEQADLHGALRVQGSLQVEQSARFRGNIGIGTATPDRTLTIEGATESFLNLRTQTGAQELLVGVDGAGGVIATAANRDLHLRAGNSSPQLSLKANGRVGIGTANPTQALEVSGDIKATNGTFTNSLAIGTATPQAKIHLEAGSLLINGEGAGLIVDEGGHKRVGFMKYIGREGGIWRLSNQDFEIGRLDAAVTALPGNPTTFTTDLYVAGNGSIGIGTTNPALRFDLRGYNMLTDPNAQYNSHFPYSNNSAFVTGEHVYLRGGAPQGWRATLHANNVTGDVNVAGRIGTSGFSAVPKTAGWGGGIHTWDVEAEGTIWSRNGYQSGNRDVAENFAALTQLEPGDVVCLDRSEDKVRLSAQTNDVAVMGVVSTAPGVLLNQGPETEPDHLFPIALCGRIPCKVVAENGPIQRGDLLTTSSTPGRAMKAQPLLVDGQPIYRPGTIIGKALAGLTDGEGVIDIFVGVG